MHTGFLHELNLFNVPYISLMLGFQRSSKLLVGDVYAAIPELPDDLLGLGLADTFFLILSVIKTAFAKFLLSSFTLIFLTFSMRLLVSSSPILPYKSGT